MALPFPFRPRLPDCPLFECPRAFSPKWEVSCDKLFTGGEAEVATGYMASRNETVFRRYRFCSMSKKKRSAILSGFSIGRLHMGGTSAGGQSVNGGDS